MSLEAAFWLASYPKSGNTWVRLVFTAYHLGVLDINKNSMFSQNDCNIHLHNVVAPMPLTEMEPQQVIYLRHAVLMNLLVSTKYKPNIIKTHCAHINVGGVELIPGPMSAGAVYIVRDPRDIVSSFAKHSGISVDMAIASMSASDARLQVLDTAIASWLQTWSNHVRSWDIPGCVRVRYEDMKEDPVVQFTRIFEGFAIKVDSEKLIKAIEQCELNRLVEQEEANGFVEKGKADKFFGQGKGWENELTEEQVKKIELDHGEMMESLGYKLEYL